MLLILFNILYLFDFIIFLKKKSIVLAVLTVLDIKAQLRQWPVRYPLLVLAAKGPGSVVQEQQKKARASAKCCEM